MGENGTGKSTLIKTLLGLRQPLEGNIEFGEELKPTEIGYLPQQTMVQRDFPASVWEVVLSGNLNKSGFRPFYSKEEKERARHWRRQGGWQSAYRNLERMGRLHEAVRKGERICI